MKLIGQELIAFSKLQNIEVNGSSGDKALDIDSLLHQISTSSYRDMYTHITMHQVMFTMTNMAQLITDLKFLKSIDLANIAMASANVTCSTGSDRSNDVSDVLHHISISPNRDQYTNIKICQIMCTATSVGQLISNLKKLQSVKMDKITLTEGNVTSVDVKHNLIEHLSLHLNDGTEGTEHTNQTMNANHHMHVHRKYKFKLQGCKDSTYVDSLLHQISTSSNTDMYTHITMHQVIFTMTNMAQLISNLKFLKSIDLANTAITSINTQGSNGSDRSNDISDVLHHLSISPNIDQFARIKLSNIMCSIINMIKLISNMKKIESIDLDKVTLTEGIVASEEVKHNQIEQLTLQLIASTEVTEHTNPVMNSQQDTHKQMKYMLKIRGCDASNAVFQSLCKHMITPQIQELDLEKAKLKEDHIKILSEFLPNASNLQKLELSWNTVGMAMVPLAQQLQYCTRLSQLDLCSACITDQGVIELVQRFQVLPHLTYLGLCNWFVNIDKNNCIGNDGLHAVFKNIHHLTKLENFDIEAIIDNQCRNGDLVKDCLAAIGERIPEQTDMIHTKISKNAKQIQSIKAAAVEHL